MIANNGFASAGDKSSRSLLNLRPSEVAEACLVAFETSVDK